MVHLGMGQFNLSKRTMTTVLAGNYDDGISSLTALYDKQVRSKTLLYIALRASYLFGTCFWCS